MSDWNPQLYTRFEAERTRPASELLARIDTASPGLVVDLGCGPGNSTELLACRWPQTDIVGIDNSEAMLASACARLPNLRFELGDIGAWMPARPPDVIYANAALQWVDGHQALYPRLFAALAPGGVLAVQIPDNRDEPSHVLMREVAGLDGFASLIGKAASMRSETLAPHAYYDLLAPDAVSVDVWRTTYLHPMPSATAIVDWLRGTGLRPFLDRLDAAGAAAFLAEYERRIDAAYPTRTDGRRLLAFPRLFLVAVRRPAEHRA